VIAMLTSENPLVSFDSSWSFDSGWTSRKVCLEELYIYSLDEGEIC
jgi:hypothetical protein